MKKLLKLGIPCLFCLTLTSCAEIARAYAMTVYTSIAMIVIGIAIHIFLCHLVGSSAIDKGRDYTTFFLVALFLSPIISGLILLIQGDDKQEIERRKMDRGELKRCPFCAELIKREATLCKYCGREIPREEKKEIKSLPVRKDVKNKDISSEYQYKVVSISEKETPLTEKKVQRQIKVIDKQGDKHIAYRTEKKHKKKGTTYKYFLSDEEEIFNVEDDFTDRNNA